MQTQPTIDLGMNQDALQFRREEEVSAPLSDVERFDTEAVAGQNQALPGIGPDGNREHPSKFLETTGAPLQKCLKHRLRVAVRLKAMTARFEFSAKFQMVVNFAVEDDNGIAVFREDRLITFGKIQNLQPCGAEMTARRPVYALLVGAAMEQSRSRCPNALRIGAPILRGEANYATQIPAPRGTVPLFADRSATA
jgi:hypothetical protein